MIRGAGEMKTPSVDTPQRLIHLGEKKRRITKRKIICGGGKGEESGGQGV